MTVNEALDDYEKSAQEYVDAKNLYRNEHARILLSLVDPENKPEGFKKPTEKVLDAMLDSNPKLQLLRADRDRKEILAISCRLAAEAVVNISGKETSDADE